MKKNAFTLIELLAVIVILAIISLIATPIVLNIIKDSKESSQLRSANFYLDAVETSVAQKIINDQAFRPKECDIKSDGNLNCKGIDVKVEVKGETPIGGKITLQNGKIDYIKLKYENDKIIGYDENKKLIFLGKDPYQESENIEIPDLYNNTLTPVIYNGDNWVIADVTEKWYDYSNQEWANAVILDSSVKKEVGDTITVDGNSPDVLAMFVWIPRYEYKIEGTYGKGGTSASSPGEIEVNFITKETKEASDVYRIHPAFNFGGKDINGLWIGKFELTHTTNTLSLGCKTEICIESNGLRILPNVQSLRYNNVSSFFFAIKSMSKEDNVFGINSSITDSHMIKNSEWGSVSYLSQSRYGKYGNNNYEGTNKEVYINNSSNMITGRSGGSCEYVMGVFANSDGEKWSHNSGFIGKATESGTDVEGLEWPNEKYYDLYKASSGTTINSTTACNGGVCYGQAFNETSGWYNDSAYFVTSLNPWFYRGGDFSNDGRSGLFNSSNNDGPGSPYISSRVVFTQAT